MSRSSLTPLSPVHVIPISIHVYHAFSKVINRLRHSKGIKCVILSLHPGDISSSSLLLAGGDALNQSNQQIVSQVNIITMVSNLLYSSFSSPSLSRFHLVKLKAEKVGQTTTHARVHARHLTQARPHHLLQRGQPSVDGLYHYI